MADVLEETGRRCLELPRFARLRFLANYAERAEPLYAAHWLYPRGLEHGEKLGHAIAIVDKYGCDPSSVSRAELEKAKSDAEAADSDATCLITNNHNSFICSTVAEAVTRLLEFALDPQKCNGLSCAFSCENAVELVCKDIDTVVRTLTYDLDALKAEAISEKWNDESSAPLYLRPIWRFEKPKDWPSEGIAFAATVGTKLLKGGFLGTLTRILKGL